MKTLQSRILFIFLFLFCAYAVYGQQPLGFKSVETYAGSGFGSSNGNRLNARFDEPIDLVFDANGNLYIAEAGGSLIRIMRPDGSVSDFVGRSGSTCLVNCTGATARFNLIRGMSLDNDGNLIVADKDNHAIRKVTPAGVVTTVAGTGSPGYLDGNVSVAILTSPPKYWWTQQAIFWWQMPLVTELEKLI